MLSRINLKSIYISEVQWVRNGANDVEYMQRFGSVYIAVVVYSLDAFRFRKLSVTSRAQHEHLIHISESVD